MNATERSISEQFDFWLRAPDSGLRAERGRLHVFVGCGTSYYLALSLASAANATGLDAIAVPGNEWAVRPRNYVSAGRPLTVVAISRSGESSETIHAAYTSRAAGHRVIVLTCERGSSLTLVADEVCFAETHPDEGIVMTSSASLCIISSTSDCSCPKFEDEITSSIPNSA